jgi:hypothetical protein
VRNLTIDGQPVPARPADACPYPKPFTAEFNDCPTYQTRHAIVVDSKDRPLRTIWSCRHMETKQAPAEAGRYYGACRLGDAKGRQQWVQAIGADRIRHIQKLRAVVMPVAQAFVDDMAGLKSQQLEAARANTDQTLLLAKMRDRGRRYLEDLEALLTAHGELLQLALMPGTAVMQLARQWVEEFISETWARSQSGQELPDDLVGSLPDSVRVFYTPR